MKLVDKIHDASLERALVMGVLNVTPDSFSDGGRFLARSDLQKQVEAMVACGVDIIDIGGESTRPGASEVSSQEELDRTQPVIEWIKSEFSVYTSIDTYKPQVMTSSIGLGVDLINDINALQAEGALNVVAKADIPVCLMHMKGRPATMQQAPEYEDVVYEVQNFLQSRRDQAIQAGVKSQNILLDPGFGFGKTLAHNVRLFEELESLHQLECPILVGVSRKKMIGQLLANGKEERPVDSRMIGSVAAAMLAQLKGARIIRVHDVCETIDALKIAMALL